MDYKSLISLKLNGELMQKKDLKSFAEFQMNSPLNHLWQKSIFFFIHSYLDDSAFIITKTSGSSGLPKPIKIQKQHMVNSALNTGNFLNLKKGDKALLCLPADFIAGKMMIVRAMVLGLNLIIAEPKGNPLKDRDEVFDFAAMTPMQIFQILECENGEKKLNNIQNLIIGGSSVLASLREKIRKLTNHTFSTYGMTETITHIAMEKLTGLDADGYYHLLPGISVESDEANRLIIKAPAIADEWIYTNDLVTLKTADTFKVVGRYDNLIISGGINIIPEALEEKLAGFIKPRFCISSTVDEKLGEQLVLVFEDEPWPRGQVQELFDKIPIDIQAWEKPKVFSFVSVFPETENHKINRPVIKNLLLQSRLISL